VKLNAEERLRLAMWIDANAPYHDRFVNKRPEQPAYDLAMDQSLQQRLAGVHERRCIACHKPAEVTRVDWIDIRAPQRSLFLTAPLAAMAGGTGKCGRAVYADATDPDYRAVLGLVEEAVARQWSQPRRDVQSLTRPTTPAKVARN